MPGYGMMIIEPLCAAAAPFRDGAPVSASMHFGV
jgi:hypothetical protein